MKKIINTILAVLTFALLSAGAYGASFYLSTEKSFMPDESARVKIESQGLGSLGMRVYRVTDPAAFIKNRTNLNRVYFESDAVRSNPAELFMRFRNIFNRSIHGYVAGRVPSYDTRQNGASDLGRFFDERAVRKSITIGRMTNMPLVKEFGQVLSVDSGWTYTYADLGRLSNGLYVVEAWSESAVGYTLVHVSELGLLIKKSDDGLFALTLDKKSGQARRATVRVIDFNTGKDIKSGDSGEKGLFETALQPNRYSEVLVTAEVPFDFAFYKMPLFPAAARERLVYIYTDSPIYRYGNRVEIKAVVRDSVNGQYQVPGLKSASVAVMDPRGQVTLIGNSSVNDFGTLLASYDVPDNAPAGIYKVSVTADGRTHRGEFRVENFQKPLFKVAVSPEKPVSVGGEEIRFRVRADYFSGTPVNGARVRYSIFRTPLSEDIFDTTRDIFEDPSYAAKIEFLETSESRLDGQGNLSASFNPSRWVNDRDYAYIIKAEVTDGSYARANGSATVKVVKADFSMRAEIGKSVYLAGEQVTVNVRVLFPDGKPVQGQEISFSAWLEDDGRALTSGKSRTDDKGLAVFRFQASGKGYLRVECATQDRLKNPVKQTVYTWVGQDGATFVYKSGDITIVLDKEQYLAGEKARVLVLSPVPYARALVSQERDTLLSREIKEFKGNALVLDIPVEKRHAPNFFLSVTFVFNNTVYENTVKIKVPPSDRLLNVAVTSDRLVYDPGAGGTITLLVTDQAGRPVQAEVSVSVVDEALYRLSPEIFTDPRLFFYAYRWNSVSTFHSIGLRFYGYSREVRERYAMSYYHKKIWDFEDFLHGGVRFTTTKEEMSADKKAAPDKGNTAADGEPDVRTVFKDQVLWQGQVRTDLSGRASVPVNFAHNLTEWRVTAVAFTKDTSVGRNTLMLRTYKEFQAELSFPRTLSVSDSARGMVVLQNNTAREESVTLTLECDNGQAGLPLSSVTVPARGRRMVGFTLVPALIGSGKIKLTARGVGRSDALAVDYRVLPVSLPRIYTVNRPILKSGDGFEVRIPEGVVPSSIEARGGLSEMENPIGAVLNALPFLKSYPYGCVEQTTSSFLPTLFALEAAKTLALKLPDDYSDYEQILRRGVDALSGYQAPNGHWGWYGESEADYYMTAYVLYALNFVKRNYPTFLNEAVYKKGVAALTDAVNRRYTGEGPLLAYALYVLSESGVRLPDMVKRLAGEQSDNPYVLSCLVLSARNNGLTELAGTLSARLEKLAVQESGLYSWSMKDDYWYGSPVISTALAVRAMLAGSRRGAVLDGAVAYLVLNRQGSQWRSTRESAEAVFALAQYASSGNVKIADSTVTVRLDGRNIDTLQFGGKNFKNSFMISPELLSKAGIHRFVFETSGRSYIADLRISLNTDEKSVTAEDRGISVGRRYYRVYDKNRMAPIRDLSLSAGDIVLVEIMVSAKGRPPEYLIIEDALPGGFVPVWKQNEYSLGVDFNRNVTRREFLRGKAAFFLRGFSSGSYYYLMQAAYPGSYYALPALCYGMYEPERQGNSDSAVWTIRGDADGK